MKTKIVALRQLIFGCIMILFTPFNSYSYGLLAHEALIDAAWEHTILPILKDRFPNSTEIQLKDAHAFAYGGAIIPDIGYSPFGSTIFSQLLHYSRSGDFVKALLFESKSLNEFSFAIGVLSHFIADEKGHPFGTNMAVAILFPRLEKRYGKQISFEQGKNQHSRVEFGFDVLQTARGNYQTNEYHDFIGFKISDSVLDKAFVDTYGLHLGSIFKSLPLAVSVFRYSVKTIIPEMTKDAWKIKKSFITQMNPLATEKDFNFKMSKENYTKEFVQPKFQSFIITVLIGVIPKYGPLSKFKPKLPSPIAETYFQNSFDSSTTQYRNSLKFVNSKNHFYTNINLDTGNETIYGEYKLADKTYYSLLKKLKHSHFESLTPDLKKNINEFYSHSTMVGESKAVSAKQKKVIQLLAIMNAK
jgi:hypothetical protein